MRNSLESYVIGKLQEQLRAQIEQEMILFVTGGRVVYPPPSLELRYTLPEDSYYSRTALTIRYADCI